MEKKLIRVKYNEKRLQFLDATLPYLVLRDGEVLYNFDYFATSSATFIRALNEFDVPTIPYRLWNFKGEDLTTYHNTIVEIEYDENVVYEAAREVFPKESDEFYAEEVRKHYKKLLDMDEGICEARQDIEETYENEKKEKERRMNLLERIANETAKDPDALPSPEVMQMRIDESNKILEDAFKEPESTEIKVETPKIITSSVESTPTKLIK